MHRERTIAYFTMEIALDPDIPTFAGGLGVLAGDFARAAADLRVPMAIVSLVHRKGYFHQRLGDDGWQTEDSEDWPLDAHLTALPERVEVEIEGRPVVVAAWRYAVRGAGGYAIPAILLDTDLPENDESDRELTHFLYGGDHVFRLRQEILLGVGGIRMLRALGYHDLRRYHMNEGHAAFLVLELLKEKLADSTARDTAFEEVHRQCVFTTHTPVPAGHDRFAEDLVEQTIEPDLLEPIRQHDVWPRICINGEVNMTALGFVFSHFINGVARRHGEVSRRMFPEYPIDSITNGIHALTWVSPSMAALFDQHIPHWREDSSNLRHARMIDSEEIRRAHLEAKRKLVAYINRHTHHSFSDDVFTIGFGRRAAPYKRADLILSDPDRLHGIASRVGPIQLVFGGKAHPNDHRGKELVKRVFGSLGGLEGAVRGVYLANYDMRVCRLMIGGVDLWLNTPQPPLEASGTSGMKAAVNGVPSLSTLDGWWIEGCLEGVTGWAIGGDLGLEGLIDPTSPLSDQDRQRDAEALYGKLEYVILPMYHQRRRRFAEIMRKAIAINGTYFNTHRMMHEYVTKAYLT